MKAIALLSGGLDSILAVKLVQEQGVDVITLSFVSGFFGNKKKLKQIAEKNKINLKIIDLGSEYINLVRKPKHGYGKCMNPCIDCKILMLKKAKQYAEKINAKFIITGEVLGQRPMSQRMAALSIIEREAGLKGKLLRPLCARLLAETEAEKNKFIDRSRLLKIKGRGRRTQLALAKKFNVKNYKRPAGGCILCEKGFAVKLKDLFKHKKNKKIEAKDIELLKLGRHFRFKNNKIIVGRDEKDNMQLLKLKEKSDFVFEAKNEMGPVTLLQGQKTKKAVEKAAMLTARYSDAEKEKIPVSYGKEKPDKEIIVNKIKDKEIEKLRTKD